MIFNEGPLIPNLVNLMFMFFSKDGKSIDLSVLGSLHLPVEMLVPMADGFRQGLTCLVSLDEALPRLQGFAWLCFASTPTMYPSHLAWQHHGYLSAPECFASHCLRLTRFRGFAEGAATCCRGWLHLFGQLRGGAESSSGSGDKTAGLGNAWFPWAGVCGLEEMTYPCPWAFPLHQPFA